MPPTNPTSYRTAPLWLRMSCAYEAQFRNHIGKRTILRALFRTAALWGRPFVARMQNGILLAIAPAEALEPWSVGWSCFRSGVWEPHIERALNRFLRPGDVGYDIGANLGYFSAVMGRAVGPTGVVVSLEPVAETFSRLVLCRELNAMPQMRLFQLAAGAANGFTEMRFNSRDTGNASTYSGVDRAAASVVTVPVIEVDRLRDAYGLPAPTLMKIDVEGGELSVMQGAAATLAAHQPKVVFELNASMMKQAGWLPSDIASFLTQFGQYRFFRLGEEDTEAIDLARVEPSAQGYFDVLAVP